MAKPMKLHCLFCAEFWFPAYQIIFNDTTKSLWPTLYTAYVYNVYVRVRGAPDEGLKYDTLWWMRAFSRGTRHFNSWRQQYYDWVRSARQRTTSLLWRMNKENVEAIQLIEDAWIVKGNFARLLTWIINTFTQTHTTHPTKKCRTESVWIW